MSCGYGEKLVLYFYGEAGDAARAEVEAHLPGCAACRGELAALAAASDWLDAALVQPPARAVAAVMAAARSAGRARTFRFGWREALFSGALAAVMMGVFAFSVRPVASSELAWNSGLDTSLDSVEESLYQVKTEVGTSSGDWDYSYSALEDESSRVSGSV